MDISFGWNKFTVDTPLRVAITHYSMGQFTQGATLRRESPIQNAGAKEADERNKLHRFSLG
jgi:hypothetical protein